MSGHEGSGQNTGRKRKTSSELREDLKEDLNNFNPFIVIVIIILVIVIIVVITIKIRIC